MVVHPEFLSLDCSNRLICVLKRRTWSKTSQNTEKWNIGTKHDTNYAHTVGSLWAIKLLQVFLCRQTKLWLFAHTGADKQINGFQIVAKVRLIRLICMTV